MVERSIIFYHIQPIISQKSIRSRTDRYLGILPRGASRSRIAIKNSGSVGNISVILSSLQYPATLQFFLCLLCYSVHSQDLSHSPPPGLLGQFPSSACACSFSSFSRANRSWHSFSRASRFLRPLSSLDISSP